MKTGMDFDKKAKNSFIYFQLGLVFTMLFCYLALEYKSKVVPIVLPLYKGPVFIDEPYIYNPIIEIPEEVKIDVSAVTSVAAPAVKASSDVVEIKIEQNEIELPKTDIPTQDNVGQEVGVGDKDSQGLPGGVQNGVANNGVVSGNSDVHNIFAVEQLPMFKACKGLVKSAQKACFDKELKRAISRYLVYPEDDFENGREGAVMVEFVIDENGDVVNVRTVGNRKATPEMQMAAEKAVSRIPKLIPARQGNRNVKVKYVLPITFRNE
ncbi:energy transducer TonB [Flavobacterium chuncheonense]|uniref:Energy transducer TonB n=1 Tax=Flavobacterium chuncheonense TaxID=2026653 RepID=A0ABW5YND3_9FLAO